MAYTKAWNANDLEEAQPTQWLAKGWLPRGAMTILVGDEGIGKSLFWVRMAAAVSAGTALPECGLPARDPEIVTVVITEDDWATTVRPRLEMAGANLDNIRVICGDRDGSGTPIFPRDIHLIKDTQPGLVVVDALMDTVKSLAGNARKVLHPIKEMATETGAAVILVTHTNRTKTSNARDKYGSSSDLRKKARVTLFAQRDDDGRLVVGPEKTNISKPPKAVLYRTVGEQYFEPSEFDDGTVGVLKYVDTSNRTASEIIADDVGDERQERTEATKWLEGFLAIHGTVLSATAKEEAKKDGISVRTLQRARRQLKVDINYVGQPPVSTWALPPERQLEYLAKLDEAGQTGLIPEPGSLEKGKAKRRGEGVV